MNRLTFVLGGIRSGKSRFAQDLAHEAAKNPEARVLYVATGRAADQEMRDRIARHQADRPENWDTAEAPLAVAQAVEEAGHRYAAILIDCLSFLITNLVLSLGEEPDRNAADRLVTEEMDRLLPAIRVPRSHVIVVSNEVGIGLVAPYYLGRMFQDVAGRAHQRFAAEADEVYFMIAGLPQRVK
jgi:adenosylcobinamide kinase / adenosylcobinamide-phosphate guanylyltransferase